MIYVFMFSVLFAFCGIISAFYNFMKYVVTFEKHKNKLIELEKENFKYWSKYL